MKEKESKKLNYKNATYTKSGFIKCMIEHPRLGWIPFYAKANDPSSVGRKIYEYLITRPDIEPYKEPVD